MSRLKIHWNQKFSVWTVINAFIHLGLAREIFAFLVHINFKMNYFLSVVWSVITDTVINAQTDIMISQFSVTKIKFSHICLFEDTRLQIRISTAENQCTAIVEQKKIWSDIIIGLNEIGSTIMEYTLNPFISENIVIVFCRKPMPKIYFYSGLHGIRYMVYTQTYTLRKY